MAEVPGPGGDDRFRRGRFADHVDPAGLNTFRAPDDESRRALPPNPGFSGPIGSETAKFFHQQGVDVVGMTTICIAWLASTDDNR